MADKDIGLTLQLNLDQSKKDLKAIQDAGGFSGKSGAKNLNKIQSILASFDGVDLSKLDAKKARDFLNELGRARSLLDSAAKGLSTYSKSYTDQQEKVHKANLKLTRAQDEQSKALEKQAEALKKLKGSSATFYNKENGRPVSNPQNIASLYEKNQLEIRAKDRQTLLSGAALTSVESKIKDVATTTKEVEAAKMEVETANATLKAEKVTLENMPQGGELNPVTKQVTTNTQDINDQIALSKDQLNAEQSHLNEAVDIDATTKALDKQSSSFGKAFRQFSIYAIALRTAKKALQEVKTTIKDLDKYLTEQAMVTGKTRKETYALLGSYQEMASQLGATTKEVANVATQFMRQGKTTADALTLTRAAISAAKVAGIDATQSVDYLTTALNGFQLSAEQAMKVSDKFASIAAQSATSYEEIAIALSKVAAQANLAGMSIDYTTALLAKGIETTREAPETIGTALKTVIARMRELGDYGETLEEGMNINNVETQLQYVGIALREDNGELRSTEDVLDELGKKWDTLSSNQQAAIAKALAGTRQQSRLIAMMNDYERVTELQEIAQRSAGATAAQAAVYMEGMEAALNKVNVAWEKIISAVTDSDVIIGIIDAVANVLDNLGEFLDSTAGMITTLTLISVIGITILGNKMREMELAKLQQKYTLAENRLQNAKNIALAKENIEKLKIAKQNAKARLDAALERKQQLKKLSDIIQERKLKGAITTAAEKYLQKEQAANAQEIQEAQTEYEQATANLSLEQDRLSILEKQDSILQGQENLVSKIGTGITGMLTPLIAIIGFIQAIKMGMAATKVYQEALNKGLDKQAAKEARNNALAGAGMFAKVVAAFAQLGPWGVIAGIAIGAALAAAIGVAIAAATGNLPSQQGDAAEKTAQDINKLSNEIYKLNERANAIKNITSQYDDLDNKIVKTAEDQKKMNELLDSAADKLDEEQKETYNALTTDKQRYNYLKQVERDSRSSANEKRKEQISKIRGLNSSDRAKLLASNATDAEILEAQSAIYALNNNTLYEYIDNLGDAQEGVEKLTQSILENMSVEEAWAYANDETHAGIKALTDAINKLQMDVGGDEGLTSTAKVLASDSYTFSQRIEAFKQLEEQIASTGDSAALASFREAYSEW